MERYAIRGILLALFVVLTGIASGQATDGNIAGVVTDETGAAVPGASLELENSSTGVKFNTKSNDAGVYRFNNIPVGLYTLTASGIGFTGSRLEQLTLDLNKTATANIVLKVGTVTTSIEVVDAPATLDTTTAQIASTYQVRHAIDLPASSLPMGPLNVALLSAGVASSGGTGVGEGPSIGGQRPRNNSFNVEGIDNNRKDITGNNVRVPNEATQEVTILQNQFSAEFGHSSGGVFNTLIKSGTNDIHGSIYEYLQNRNFNAVDEAYKRNNILENPRYDQNNLGATIGGPLVKNKLFYFGNFEYNPLGVAGTRSASTYAPTAEGYAMLAALGNQLSATNLGILQKYLPAAPAQESNYTAAVLGQEIPVGVVPLTFPQYTNSYRGILSIDYNPSERDQIRSRYVDQRLSGIYPGSSPNLPAFSASRETTSKLFTFSEFHTFTPSITNEFRAAYSRFNDDIPANDYDYPGLDAFPNIYIQEINVQIGPYSGAPQATIINNYQLIDNINVTKGRHGLKFGVEGRKYIAPNNYVARERGDYEYSAVEKYLLDLTPDLLAARNLGGTPYSGNQQNFYWFANDNIRLRPNLTVNLGIRYEYKSVLAGDKLQVLNAVSSRPGFLDFRDPEAQKYNFAPRIGIAWSPGASGLTSIRAGFGMAYDNVFDNLGTLSQPVQLQNAVVDPIGLDEPNYLANGGIAPSRRPTEFTPEEAIAYTSTYVPDQKLPYSINWNLGVQRVFAKDYTVEVRYLGTRGVHLFVQDVINRQALVTPGSYLPTYLQRPSQAELDSLAVDLDQLSAGSVILPAWEAAGYQSPIMVFNSRGNSTYHGLATEVTRRFSNGLMFKAAYTWSKNIDDSTADLNSTALSPRRAQDLQNWRAERGRSFLDRTHRLTIAAIYDSPWFSKSNNWFARNLAGNWTFSPVYTAESPQYATVQSGIDSNLNGDSAADRVIVNPAGGEDTGSGVAPLTNSAGATVGYLANNPNARYIAAGYGALATGGRNTLPTRGINNWDLTVAKKFNITESKRVELRGAFYNLFNHAQYIPGSLNTIQTVDSSATRANLIPGNRLFNDPTRVYSSNSRAIQIIARFVF